MSRFSFSLAIGVLAAIVLRLPAAFPSKTSPGAFHKHRARALPAHQRHSHAECIAGDCRDGKSSIRTKYHGEYHAEYRDGAVWTGRGLSVSETEHYRGHFESGQRHGVGVLHRFSGSTRYYGRFVHGIPIGPVVTVLRNGTRWISRFLNGVPNSGKTKWEWPKDSEHGVYMGEWRAGAPSGFGVWINGTDRYEGFFREGKFHGFGIWMTSRSGGVRYDGNFFEGLFSGHGILLEPGHRRYDGSFERGMRHGIGMSRTPGAFWGTIIEKHVWNNGVIMPDYMNLPHSEL